jgi:3-methylcrotonyl-CoA carboxylase beta subunit
MKLTLDPIGSQLQGAQLERDSHAAHHAVLGDALAQKRQTVREGWGAERVHRKGKWTTWERIEALIDPGTVARCVGTLVNWGRDFAGSRRQAPGAGVVTAFCQVHGRWTMVIANDNTVASGAWWPRTPEKIQRAQEMALRMRLPVIYLVDCSGLFLPEQSRSFPARTGAGGIFRMNSVLSDQGVAQIAGVFGDCIAGGGYMPIISDRVYMTEQAYMVIAGAALIKGAKSQALTSLDIGGPEVHVHLSACADDRVPDDATCIAKIREEVSRLPSSAADFYRHGAEAEAPLLDPAELTELLPKDPRQVYDMRQVLGRLVDGSLFHEVFAGVGAEMITGVARVGGLWMGFIANELSPQPDPSTGALRPGGILYREGIAKISAFSRACNADGIPIVWLQDIAGFDIGVEAEAQGLLGYGSSLIYTNSTNSVPMFTVLMRKASGAGYYAMAGMPYQPVVQLSTPSARQSVMEGRTLAIAAFRTKLDDDFEIATEDPEERAAIVEGMAKTEARIEADMDPVVAAAQMDTDEIVRLDELRDWLSALSEMAYQSTGYRRLKNPRIWSLHDLEVLGRGARGTEGGVVPEGQTSGPVVEAPEEGLVPVRAPMAGSYWSRASPESKAFAAEDALVEAGDTVGLVEVMKTFSPIRAATTGTWVSGSVEDGGSISAGDVIGWLRPD